MKIRPALLALWSALFILCAGLSFIPDPPAPMIPWLRFLGFLFFAPPIGLMIYVKKTKDTETARLIRNLSGISLCLTVVMLVLNILSALGSELFEVFFHVLLTVVATPMLLCGKWVFSLFLWAALLVWAGKNAKR